MKINGNSGGIKNNSNKLEIVKDDVHRLELNDKDIKNMAQKSLDFMVRIDSSLTGIKTEQAKQATVQAINSVKLKTLTKDD